MLAALILFLPVCTWAQLDLGLDSARHIEYLRSIKQFSEFVDRFNQDSYTVPDLDPDRSLVLGRKQSILLLFNRDDPRFDLSSADYSDAYVQRVLEFADNVVDNGIYLNKHSDQIKAVVSTTVLYKGEPDTIQIILTQEIDDPNLVRWVISDVESAFLKIPERDTMQMRFLSPVSHELGFMDLKKVFGEPEHVIDYVRKDYAYDQLSAFLRAVEEGELVVNEVIEISYDIRLQDGYVMQVDFSENLGMVPYLEIDDLR